VIVSYASGPRRHIVLADANPAIATLPTATGRSLAEARLATGPAAPGEPAGAGPVGWRSGSRQPPPNLGPPPEPPDWRKRRR
jgi:hypothetical protein